MKIDNIYSMIIAIGITIAGAYTFSSITKSASDVGIEREKTKQLCLKLNKCKV